MLRKWGTLVLFLLATPLFAFAQNTGKLAGRVLDASTGEPLPGATVVIVGTQLGTATDVDGNYFIIGVPVGTYDIQFSFVGYQSQTRAGVEINAGYTREINIELQPGLQLDEIVIEYERPLIQKDALGSPRVVTGEEIQNLPIRGVTSVASVQAGVVNNEGSSTLNIRGGRGEEVTYYVDGVKVVGSIGVAQQAIAEQEMLIGGLPAKYGDAMGGIISVSTKGGAPRFFGSLEGITSEVLDPYGYNLASATLGGPIVKGKVSFFFAGEYEVNGDRSPQAIETPQLSDERLDAIRAQPQVIPVLQGGKQVYLPFPGDIAPGTPLADVAARLGVSPDSLLNGGVPLSAVSFLTDDDFTFEKATRNNGLTGLNLNGNVTFNPVSQVRLRVGGQLATRDYDSYSFARSIFNPENNTHTETITGRGYVSWTQYLSNSTFYQLQADYSDYKYWNYDADFSKELDDLVFYGDIDHPANAVAARYMTLVSRDIDGDGTPEQVYERLYKDGSLPQTTGVFSQFSFPGAVGPGYSKGRSQQFRLTGNATTQVGVHQIEFGGEYEQRTARAFSASPASIARLYNDGDVEAGESRAINAWTDLPYNEAKPVVSYYGYNYLGTEEVDDDDVAGFSDKTNMNLAPYKPIYYAGYIQDKIEYRDLVLQVGFRLDVFDNNQRVLRDPYALLPIVRVGDAGLNVPGTIGTDYAVYYSGNTVVGYRDLNGQFYDTNGNTVAPNEVVTRGEPRVKEGFDRGRLYDEIFTDYEPQAKFQPRIGVTFPVTDQALFFAHYDVLSQRPTTNQFATLESFFNRLEGSGNIGNPALEPQTTTEYELGFRQRLSATSAIQISGFYRQIDNLIQLRALKNVYPGNYSTYGNVDFGTVKGVEFEFDLRRTNNVALNANYTLSFAEGTGSDATTTSDIFWLREANPIVPTFLSALDFDRRHTFNLSLDYRLGKGEGPSIGGARLLENFGVNILGSFKSGQPYSAVLAPFARHQRVRLTGLKGEINGQRLPASTLINLRVDRNFELSQRASLTAFLWVENLLDSDNVVDVYRATGLANDDGYLATQEGRQLYPVGSPDELYYRLRINDPFNYGIPRTTRLGVRLNF